MASPANRLPMGYHQEAFQLKHRRPLQDRAMGQLHLTKGMSTPEHLLGFCLSPREIPMSPVLLLSSNVFISLRPRKVLTLGSQSGNHTAVFRLQSAQGKQIPTGKSLPTPLATRGHDGRC